MRHTAERLRRAELMNWILGILLGLILGYIWGQYDAYNPSETPVTTKIGIENALYHIARESMRADAPSSGLPKLKDCRNCRGSESAEISYRLLSRTWTIECGCGGYTGERRSLRAAIVAWNAENRA